MEPARKTAASRAEPIVAYPAVVAGLVCAATVLLVDVFRGVLYRVMIEPDYISLHIVLEFASIVVAYSVFAVGWYAYKQNRNTQDLYVALVFMVVGAIDFAHTLSYEGMPGLLTPNTVSKASTFWIAARLFAAVSLLIAAFIRPDLDKPWMKPRVLFPVGLVTAAAVVAFLGYFHETLPPMFVPGQGQTPFKVGLEYVVISILMLAVLAFGRFSPRDRSSVDLLQVALVVSVFSEVGFALYSSAFDTFNLLGHIFKMIAYYFILRALFVSSLQRPYSELVTAREELAELVRQTGELYEQADQQRQRLEQSFAQISSALGSSLDVDKALELIGDLAADIVGVEAGLVAVPDEERPVLQIRASRGLAPGQVVVPLHGSLAGEAITHRMARWVGEAHESRRLWRPRLTAGEVISILAVPILSDDRVLGVLSLYSPRPHAFSEKNAALLSSFARQAAVAVDNAARYARERRIAESFQRGLLPVLPEAPGLDLAARYEPASPTAEVGGDLYDAIMLDRRRLALVIGDVSGKGLDAATVMASTQYMMRGFLFQGMQPGEVLSGLHSALSQELDPSRFVTIFLAILDVRTHEMTYANAGHPCPVLITPDGCETMTCHGGGPVGAVGPVGLGGYKTDRVILPEHFGLLMYTDGLLDARDGNEFFGEDRIIEISTATRGLSSAELVNALLERAREFSDGSLTDDIALVAAKTAAPVDGEVAVTYNI